MTDVDLMLVLFVQLIVLLSACKLFGWLGTRFLGQTQVVMEMVAGVFLGPSILGAISPRVEAWLFPNGVVGHIGKVPINHPSMSILYVIAQLGLVFYMFLVGQEFNVELITKKVKGVLGVSLAGIALPFLFGGLLALGLASVGFVGLFTPNVSPAEAALYLGAAMCITAFPMLARILVERGIAQTTMGTLALGAGASNDAVAWAMLAVVLASFKHDVHYALWAIGGGTIYVFALFTLGTRLFSGLAVQVERDGGMSQPTFLTVLLILFACSFFTDAIGVYAVFGAFTVGAAMPKGRFTKELHSRIHALTVNCLLPFFFAYSGLNTKLGLLNTPTLWGICALICAAAMLGKFGGCAIAARVTGASWRSSAAIGALMNARGLMELIIINIGLKQNVITPTLYAMLVIMAILTTLMASPIFNLIYRKEGASVDDFDNERRSDAELVPAT